MEDTLEGRVQQSQRKSVQYWYADGFTEIALGLLFLILAGLFTLVARLERTSPWTGFAALALPVLVVGGIFWTRWMVRLLKTRFTYPRTGYVAYRPRPANTGVRNRLAIGMTSATIGVLVAVFFANQPAALNWIPAVQGFAIGALLFAIAVRMDLLRFYLLAAFAVLLGVGISLRIADPNWGNAAFYAGIGVALLSSGLVMLQRYIRRSSDHTVA